MVKKILATSIGFLALLGFLIAKDTLATGGYSEKDLMKSTSIIGINVLKKGSMKMTLAAESNNQGIDQAITLPPLSGNDGMVFVARFNPDQDGGSGTVAYIETSGTDKLNGLSDNHIYMGPSSGAGNSVILVADEDSGTWWTIASSYNAL